MFGNNKLRSPLSGNGNELEVKKIFKTIQGEGVYVGLPAIFIRLGGCNLACDFCDTEFEDFQLMKLEAIIKQVELFCLNDEKKRAVKLAVITGGEPLRQPIYRLCEELILRDFMVQIETNGTLYRQLPATTKIICSPKLANNGKYFPLRADLLPKITALKFLISANKTGYNQVPELGQKAFNIPVYVQPMDEYDQALNQLNRKLAVEISLETGYRLSYQIHKELGIE